MKVVAHVERKCLIGRKENQAVINVSIVRPKGNSRLPFMMKYMELSGIFQRVQVVHYWELIELNDGS